jgi:hypothetical protein
VIDALPGIEAPNLTGGISKMLPNHHITKPVFIGEVRGDGQFDVVWKTEGSSPATRGRRSSRVPGTWSATGLPTSAATGTPRPTSAEADVALTDC